MTVFPIPAETSALWRTPVEGAMTWRPGGWASRRRKPCLGKAPEPPVAARGDNETPNEDKSSPLRVGEASRNGKPGHLSGTKLWASLLVLVTAVVCCGLSGLAAEGDLRLVSTRADGTKSNADSTDPSVPADGTRVAFTSAARNLHPSATSGVTQVYVKDLQTGDLMLASSGPSGPGDNDSLWPSLSADGTRVAFESRAKNLHPVATNGDQDIYVKDLRSGELFLVSTSASGQKGNGYSYTPSISSDGTRVAFASRATNLSPDDAVDNHKDIYIKDLETGEIWLGSRSADGRKGNGESGAPSLSHEGNVVSFETLSTNLDPRDTDAMSDVYVKDLRTGGLILASTSTEEVKGNLDSQESSLSGDGTRVAFSSNSNNLDRLDSDIRDTGLDVYVKDLRTGELFLASTSSSGWKGNDDSQGPSLALGGTRVAFDSYATNLNPVDGDPGLDVCVKDLVTGVLLVASTSSGGIKGKGWSYSASLSDDGARVAFLSLSNNLDPMDTDAIRDIFLKDLSPAVTPLTLGVPTRSFTLTPSGPRRFFSFTAAAGEAIVLRLTGSDPEDQNALYVRWGALPTDTTFDQAADARSRSSQRLVIPSARETTGYVLVQANMFHEGSSTATLVADRARLELEEMSARYAGLGPPGKIHTAVLGSSFDVDTAFQLVPQSGGESLPAEEVLLVSDSRAEMVFRLTGKAPGDYHLRAESPSLGQSATLAEKFTLVDTMEGPSLEARFVGPLEGVRKYRYDRLSRLGLRFRNVGHGEMTAPLLKVVGPADTQLRLAREVPFQDGEIQVLGIHPNGIPGKLPPGGEWEIPIEFRSLACPNVDEACEERFQLYLLSPLGDDPIGWDEIEVEDTGLTEEYWRLAFPGLSSQLGATWREYHEGMADLATRLSRRGANSYSVGELYRHAVREALGRPAAAIVGRVALPGGGVPHDGQDIVALHEGTAWSSARTDAQGAFAIDWLESGEAYELALPGLSVVGEGGPGSPLRLPPKGDFLGVVVHAEPGPGHAADCPACDETGLPDKPLRPPPSAFSLLMEVPVEIVRSWDPNEKKGPEGGKKDDLDRLIPPGERLDYTIYFENKKSAKAPVHTAIVQDFLDPELFDIDTVRLRDVQIGNKPDQRVALDLRGYELWSGWTRNLALDRYSADGEIEAGLSGSDHVPVRFWAQLNWIVQEVDGAQKDMVEIRWVFTTCVEEDSVVGFLPANCAEGCDCAATSEEGEPDLCRDGRGEAYVSFSVEPLSDLAKGKKLENRAKVTFDGQELELEPPDPLYWLNILWDPFVPGPAHSPTPENGAQGIGGGDPFIEQVELAWEAARAEKYDVLVWIEDPNPTLLPEVHGLQEPRHLLEGLVARKTYRWQVRSVNEYGTVLGPQWRFKTGLPWPCPPTPCCPQPADGAVDLPSAPALHWELADPGYEGPVFYRVQLWKDKDPPQTVADGIRRSEHAGPLPVSPGQKYCWRVVTFHEDCATPGPEWSFTLAPRFVRGDVDASGSINISDAIFLLHYLFLGGPKPPCLEAADVNDDGELEPPNITDPVYLLSWLFLGGPAPRPPSPSAGAYLPAADCAVETKPQGLGCREFTPCR